MSHESDKEPPPVETPAEPEAPAEPAEDQFFAGGGADAGEDPEVDPELVQLPRRRRRGRHPLVSVVVIGLSLYLMWFMRQDLLFFLQPRTPRDVGHVTQALEQGLLTPNAYVKVQGAPDRKHALLLEGRISGYDNFFRLRRGRNRVFVQTHRSSRLSDKEVLSTHVGQVVPFDTLPYRKQLAAHLAKTMTIAHDLDFKEVKRALVGGRTRATVADREGETVTLGPNSVLWINAAFPDEWIVQFSKHAYESEEQAAAVLARLGLPMARDSESSRRFWRFVVHAGPELARKLMAQFRDRKLHVGVVRRQVSYSARWDQLRVRGDTLLIEAADPTFPARFQLQGERLVASKPTVVEVPASAVLYLTTSSAFSIPDDAVVVLAGRAPGDNWYYALLYVVLLGFATLNGVILYTRFRRRRKR